MRFGHVPAIILSGAIWLAIGCFLTFKGLVYFSHAFVATSHGPLLDLYQNLFHEKERGAMFLIFTSLVFGVFKGRLVLSKTVVKSVKRLLLIPGPLGIRDLFPVSYVILIMSMMSLGLLLRFLPIKFDIKGFVDLAVGSALINGAFLYFKQALSLKAESMKRKK